MLAAVPQKSLNSLARYRLLLCFGRGFSDFEVDFVLRPKKRATKPWGTFVD